MPFVAVIAVYLIARRVGWRPVALFVAGWAVVAGGYAALYASQHGHLGFSDYDGRFLYGQVAPFADCSRLPGLPAAERPLCPTRVTACRATPTSGARARPSAACR